MQNRTRFACLTIVLCASVALGILDVATKISSPHSIEMPGLVTVQVGLTNMGDTAALVSRLDVTVLPSGYHDYEQDIPVGVGQHQTVTLCPWVCPAGSDETCTAWITCPADSNHANDTDVVVVNPGLDVAAEVMSPRESEEPGLVPVQVRLTNLSDRAALVSDIEVWILPGAYNDYRTSISIAAGESAVVLLDSWNYAGGTETCTAFMVCFADTNADNNVDVVIVNSAGIKDRAETEPHAGMSLGLSPSPLAGDVLLVEYGLTRPGLVRVALLDVTGRVALTHEFVGTRKGELSFDLRSLTGGVYIVRLDDGRSAVTQKLVIQR